MSPLWWVARWSSRLLTSLAVAVALSLGGPALPDGGALSAAASPDGAPALAGLAVPEAVRAAGVATVTLPAGDAATVTLPAGDAASVTLPAGDAATVTLPAGDAPIAGRAFAGPHAAPLDPAASLDPAGRPARPVTAPPLPLTGLSAGATGPRAPPVG
ncbi:hypothetical protein ABZ807_03260 [Micromonospora sp. NPDC047548]|uniref:hypothetical protein n=1 Tax=Micromonospora sp. NPDC047548 TaxID=3155624 RepID=UPI0033F8916B